VHDLPYPVNHGDMLGYHPQYDLANAKEYFEEHLAIGEYYSEGQIVAGEWLGKGARLLSLDGRVKADQFLALCDNLNPNDGGKLTARTKSKRKAVRKDGSVTMKADRRVFYDFTISPPKSVSILALAAGDERIVKAHDEAVSVAMRELEVFAATRVRAKMMNRDRTTGNLITAVFRHDSSRALDPHLHSHCIVFNATFDAEEGRWKALQNEEMLAARKYVENVYYHELALVLRGYGYGIENKARGDFVVKGVPESLSRIFSKRHEQIDEQTRALLETKPELAGRNMAAVREHVAHRHRSKKMPHIPLDALRNDWRRQITDEEMEVLQRLRNGANGERPVQSVMDEDAALRWAEEHLFDRKALVREHDLWRFALERGRGESFALESLHAATAARAEYIRDQGKLTIMPVLEREAEIVRIASEGRNACSPLVPEWKGDVALDAEQLAAARQLLASWDFLMVFRGGAGTGKSFTLRTVHDALKGQGRDVQVLAPQRQQVEGLTLDGMDGAQTVSAFLTRKRMAKGAVVIVDEAGQIGAKDMLALLTFVQGNRGRVILSGDTGQHGPVQASDALWAIQEYARLPVAELTEIRRQNPARGRDKAERRRIAQHKRAVQDAAKGDIKSSFDHLDKAGAIIECTVANQHEQLSRHYLELAKSGESTLVVSPTWGEIHRVNDEVRQGLQAAGLIGNEEWEVVTHQGMDLSDAQKRDERYYGEDTVIIFNQTVKGAPKGAVGTLVAVVDDAVIVEAAGKIRSIPFRHLDRLTVCQRQKLHLSSGDRLQLKANSKDANGKRLLNGELVTVKQVDKSGRIEFNDGRFLAPDYRQFVRGYAVTSYASQGKTVDHVLFSDSGIKAATNARQWYVTISRGRRGVKIFTTDKKQLRRNVIRSGRNELALDLVHGNPESIAMRSPDHKTLQVFKSLRERALHQQQITPSIKPSITPSIRP
jgi:conjugative relaxase-like TrwC/TraI family protein